MSEGVRCMLMRGGTSKGAYFLAEDLPADPDQRDQLLLRIMGSPDPRQIDGIGGAHPLTSKVAVVSASERPDVDVDYLFLQLGVADSTVSDRQNCGNLLAGVGPFAVERGLLTPRDPRTAVRVHMLNSGSTAVVRFSTPHGTASYDGDTAISGVPGTAAAVVLDLDDTVGARGVLPTGNPTDTVDGITITCVDNGMPVVVIRASDLGLSGYETVDELAADQPLRDRIDALRTAAAHLMGLGDVRNSSVPKTTLVAPPVHGGAISTRTFIPLEPHTAIGVLGAVSVVTALMLDGAVGHELARLPTDSPRIDVEHPTGTLQVEVEMDTTHNPPRVTRTAIVRTARKLFDGVVFPR